MEDELPDFDDIEYDQKESQEDPDLAAAKTELAYGSKSDNFYLNLLSLI